MNDGPKGPDRRGSVRHFACVPVEIHRDQSAQTALIRELSVTGAQILTRTRIDEGSQLQLSLYIRSTEEAEPATGRVVRVQRRPDGGIWAYLVVIHFDEPLSHLESDIVELAKKFPKV